MAVIFKKIELENFRQYKDLSLEFSEENHNNLHVLRAKNGTGKTTFLNSITWCLYGVEKYINDENKALPLPNEKVVESTEENGSVKVVVRITMEDKDLNKVIIFERTERFRVNFNIINNNKKAIREQETFNISVTSLIGMGNSTIIDDPIECEQFVNTYFNKAIYDYYFFDGENLKNYFAKSKTEKIKNSIFNIAQVTLLDNTIKRTNELAVKKGREAKRKNPSSENYYEEKAELEKEIGKRNDDNKDLEHSINKYSEKKIYADDILSNYKPIKSDLLRKKEYENNLNKNTAELERLRNDQYSFIQEYMILLRFYPRIKKTYDMICYKEEHDELPPNINKSEIKEIIDKHLTNCPVCNSEIDENAIDYLQKLLDNTAVSTGTSHQLMKIKSSLEQMLEEVHKFESRKKELFKREKDLHDERVQYETELNKIHSYLSNYSTDDLEKNIAQAEKDSKYYGDKINEARTSISENNAYNKRDNARLNDVNNLLEKEQEKQKEKNELEKQVALLYEITSDFKTIQQKIMLVVKDEIERSTWNMFDAMIWKKHTFKSLSIDDNYEISVKNMNNKEIMGSLSATEYMALAYSFTLAIHEASGKNCPLVVDSPLGRVSDENREKMANELLKVGKDKQIIMLFTPDEYSKEVRNVYEGNAASIREFSLNDDESEVEGGNN